MRYIVNTIYFIFLLIYLILLIIISLDSCHDCFTFVLLTTDKLKSKLKTIVLVFSSDFNFLEIACLTSGEKHKLLI